MDVAEVTSNAVSQAENPALSRSEADKAKLADDFDEFLLLLTTQLKNQDPTDPVDTKELTSQLVQFSSVEQQIHTNKNLEQITGLLATNSVNSGVQYLGQVVEAEGNQGVLRQGAASFLYELDAPAKGVSVVIQNSKGQTVYTGIGSTNRGKNLVNWDGVGNFDKFNGKAQPDGSYTMLISAKDAAGEKMEAKTYTIGRVSAVESDGAGNLALTVGNLRIPADQVIAVREVGSAQADTVFKAPGGTLEEEPDDESEEVSDGPGDESEEPDETES